MSETRKDTREDNKIRLLKYLVRLEKFKENRLWREIESVRFVYRDDQIDMEMVKAWFEKRGVMKGEEFDAVMEELKASGDLDILGKGATPDALIKAEALEAEEKELRELSDLAREI